MKDRSYWAAVRADVASIRLESLRTYLAEATAEILTMHDATERADKYRKKYLVEKRRHKKTKERLRRLQEKGDGQS